MAKITGMINAILLAMEATEGPSFCEVIAMTLKRVMKKSPKIKLLTSHDDAISSLPSGSWSRESMPVDAAMK